MSKTFFLIFTFYRESNLGKFARDAGTLPSNHLSYLNVIADFRVLFVKQLCSSVFLEKHVTS